MVDVRRFVNSFAAYMSNQGFGVSGSYDKIFDIYKIKVRIPESEVAVETEIFEVDKQLDNIIPGIYFRISGEEKQTNTRRDKIIRDGLIKKIQRWAKSNRVSRAEEK